MRQLILHDSSFQYSQHHLFFLSSSMNMTTGAPNTAVIVLMLISVGANRFLASRSQNRQNTAPPRKHCGTITIGAGIGRVVATRGDEDAEPIGKGAGSSASCGTVTVDSSLTDDNGSPTRTITGGGSGSYAAWATANGVSGDWDDVDASGVANVFRYAFNKPTGAFIEPVLLDLTFNEQGKAVVVTPPLVNTTGFTFTIEASDNVDGTGNAASYPLDASGETVIDETGKTTRFFRLRAVTQ